MSEGVQTGLAVLAALGFGGVILFGRRLKRKRAQAYERGRTDQASTLAQRQLRLAEEEITLLEKKFSEAQRGEVRLSPATQASLLRKIQAHIENANEADDRWGEGERQRALLLAKVARDLNDQIIAWRATVNVAREKVAPSNAAAVDAKLRYQAYEGGADVKLIAETLGVSDNFVLGRAHRIAAKNREFAVIDVAGRPVLKRS